MPFAINDEVLESPNTKVLEINNPPMKQIPYQPFPKMVYLHPVDKTKEHRTQIVNSQEELEAAQKQGWRVKPHIPQSAPDYAILNGEFETAPEQTKRTRNTPEAA